ncbi:synapse-associated protein [Anaeramoeba flamelloides]|uniref:Synapse-associated protein n=1 Tax=Anaeramoeba flamelloides TaxID=1746091 RepID=A0AAV8AC88_9EUKA|nr:synapse-associated protein [Anaeramoeba flamelloides]
MSKKKQKERVNSNKTTFSFSNLFKTENKQDQKKKKKQRSLSRLPPWDLFSQDEVQSKELQKEILYLSKKTSNFTKPPPHKNPEEFQFILERYKDLRNQCLKYDARLVRIRNYLIEISSRVDEFTFWKHYFWRVMILAKESEKNRIIRQCQKDSSQINSIKKTESELFPDPDSWMNLEQEIEEELSKLGIIYENKEESNTESKNYQQTNDDNKVWDETFLQELQSDLNSSQITQEKSKKNLKEIDDKWLEEFKKEIETNTEKEKENENENVNENENKKKKKKK